MKSGELAAFLSDALEIKLGTVLDYAKHLRGASRPLLSIGTRGRYAGADMTNADAVNWLIALAIKHGYGGDIASNVRRVRALPAEPDGLVELPNGFTRTLQFFTALNAGKSLEAILGDIRDGTFVKWAAGENFRLKVTIESRGERVFLSLTKPKQGAFDFRNAVHSFAKDNGHATRLVERSITIEGELFMLLASKLGPAA